MCENNCSALGCPVRAENEKRPSWLKRKLSEMKWWLIHLRNRWKKSPMERWVENIKDSCDVEDTIKPVYNFKASD